MHIFYCPLAQRTVQWQPSLAILVFLSRPSLALHVIATPSHVGHAAFKVDEVRPFMANWVTGPFGQCMKTVCGAPVKKRTVACWDAMLGAVVPDAACASSAELRPSEFHSCSCELEVCSISHSHDCSESEERQPTSAGSPAVAANRTLAPPGAAHERRLAPGVPERRAAATSSGAAAPQYAKIGCFKLHPGDSNLGIHPWVPSGIRQLATPTPSPWPWAGAAAGATQPVEVPFDTWCINWTAVSKCRSGLPFFRNMSALTPESCYEFCIQRGLDVFGLVRGAECRCGASKINTAVWHWMPPRPAALFEIRRLNASMASDGECPLLVYRYTGFFEMGGIPLHLTSPFVQETAYVDSIVSARYLPLEAMDDGHNTKRPMSIYEETAYVDSIVSARYLPLEAMDDGHNTKRPMSIYEALSFNDAQTRSQQQQQLQQQQQQQQQGAGGARHNDEPQWARSCYPSNCGAGRGPWTQRTSVAPQGVPAVWKEYTIVPYMFALGMDDIRKDTFREAAANWHSVTCIVLEERKAQPADNVFIEVTNVDSKSCYVSGVGVGRSFLNLGWCKDSRHLGNVIHEIGHALGMVHEHQRMDATSQYHGKGPHLVIYWGSISSGWEAQYKPKKRAYVGSSFDGVGDMVAGYTPYDFGSIMHYAAWNHFDTIPGAHREQAGQRSALSHSDILQVIDMYQCHPS